MCCFNKCFVTETVVHCVVVVIVPDFFFLCATMTKYKHCSRDDCPPTNIKPDSTTKCFYCKRVVHLLCIGINVKLIQISSPNIRILCMQCANETSNETQPVDMNASIGSKSTPKAEKMSMRQVMNEVKLLRNIVEENGKKIDKIEEKTTAINRATDVLVDKATRPALMHRAEMQMPPKRFTPQFTFTSKQLTPKSANLIDLQLPSTPIKPTFANVLKKTQSAKRQRIDKPAPKKNVPPAKPGTKSMSCSLSVTPPRKREEKTKFERAVWASRFKPEVTNEQIIELIMANTSIKDKNRMNVHKLVKKNCDLSQLKFVSFKIESNSEDFEILNDPSVWPEHIMVRAFLQDLTMGDYLLPPLNEKRKSNTEVMDMDSIEIIDISPEKKSKSMTQTTEVTSPSGK